jgi:hypothetical protein
MNIKFIHIKNYNKLKINFFYFQEKKENLNK